MSGIVDFHIHSAPSIVERHAADREMFELAQQAGITTAVFKAHEGSSAGRAKVIGEGAVGGVVLNSAIGGANPDAVKVSGLLGGRIVWMPTLSSPAHRAAHANPELHAHKGIELSEVPITEGGELLPQWLEVFDEVAAADMVLASGHITLDEALLCFRAAHQRGVRRFLVNHPLMPFLGWREEHAAALASLDARIEVGVLADILCPRPPSATEYLASVYPDELLVFGSDLGHAEYPPLVDGIRDWTDELEQSLGGDRLRRIMTSNGAHLLA